MNERDRLAADLRSVMRESHGPNGPSDLRGDDPHDWLAARLLDLGWTWLDEERLARALHRTAVKNHNIGEQPIRGICRSHTAHADRAAAFAKAYREDEE